MNKLLKKPLLLGATLFFGIGLASCSTISLDGISTNSASSVITTSSVNSNTSSSNTTSSTVKEDTVTEDEYENVEVEKADTSAAVAAKEIDYGDFSITSDDGEYSVNNGVFKITKAGTYRLQGTLSEGQVLVDAGEDDEVVLELNGVSISSSSDSPIKAITLDKLKIKSIKDTENVIIDNRNTLTTEDDSQGKGAIYSKADTNFVGKGTLRVTGNYYNGIHVTKDVKIKNSSISVYAYNNALKGNNSVTITSGDILLIAKSGNGIITEDSDVSSKGNQKGNVTISGGQVDIYSCKDGIDAAYNVDVYNGVDEDDESVSTIPVINITTNKYSSYSIITTSTSSSSTTKNLSGGSKGGNQPGGNQPGGNQPGGFNFGEGNTDKATDSAKGFKASNNIYVAGGVINIKAYDDAIHANYGDTLDNNETGQGNVYVSGGQLTLYASDDGLHADNTLEITGGTTNITNSYEGLEGNTVNIKGGNTVLYATDDGVNAALKGPNKTPSVNVSGGLVDITINGNDVDGIDSNGNFSQTGGIVITRGAAGGNNSMSTGLDVDNTASVTGGTFIAFGSSLEKTPSLGSSVKSYTSSNSYGTGTWKFVTGSTTITTTNSYSYSGLRIYSSLGNSWTISKA